MTIQELLAGAGLDYLESGHNHCRTGWLQVRVCPFCGSQNYHLGFNLSDKFFACWKCRWHPVWETLLKLGVSSSTIREFLHDYELGKEPEKAEWSGRLKEPGGRGPLQRCHRDYLKRRGFDPEEIQRLWQVEGIGIDARLAWRIYIPILSKRVRVSWTTRAIGDRAAKRYLSAPETEASINLKHVIYGADWCRHAVVIVEGPIDAWAVGPGAGALFGLAWTSEQVKTLAGFPRRYICLDSSLDAQARARELADLLACFPGVTENIVIDAKDPAESSKKELRLIRKVAGL